MPEGFVVSDNARGLSDTTKPEGTLIVPIITRSYAVFVGAGFVGETKFSLKEI